jgi:hypothetical protein
MPNLQARKMMIAALQSLRPREVFEARASCAVHDRPWAARWKKEADGRYTFFESVRIEEKQGTGGNGAPPAPDSIDVHLFDEAGRACAWCGNNEFVRCKCGWVCGGRSDGSLFRCRKSCGEEFRTVPARKIDGGTSKPNEPPPKNPGFFTRKPVTSAQAAQGQGDRAQLPAVRRPMLGDGSKG